MKKFNGNETSMETLASAQVISAALSQPRGYAQYVGLDVHKDTIAVALAAPGRGEPHYDGEIAHTPKAVKRLVQRLSAQAGGEQLVWCYEAGPCGYGLYRLLLSLGQACEVVAPPTRERIKTDRRDALKLARKLRAGELTRVWVPGVEQEAMRDFTRCRSDFKAQQLKARQQLNAFVLRHGHHWERGKSRWTRAHWQWLEQREFAHPWQQQVLREYLEAVESASERVKQLEAELLGVALPQWSLAPVVDSLVALRGIDKVAAVTLLAELGDVSRFDSPRELMGFLGLVPSVHDSGQRRGRRGAITRMGNGHARRMLVEAAWCHRFPARQTAHLKRKAANASREAKAIAWQAQKRLCGRYRTLLEAGKNKNVTCVAVARELAGFVWAIVCQEMPKLASA
jgi:transposase